MLGIALAAAGVAALAWVQGLSTILAWLVQPDVLIGLFIINLVFFVFRLFSVIDAYLSPDNTDDSPDIRGWRSAVVAIALALVLTATAAPHAVLGYYTYLTHDTLTEVFSGDYLAEIELQPSPVIAEPTMTPIPTATPAPMSTPVPTPQPGETPVPTPSPEPSPTPVPSPTPEPTAEPVPVLAGTDWQERGRLTVLLVGADSAPDRSGLRTDAMMIGSIDLETGQVAVFSIPRNYGDIPLPPEIAQVMGTDVYAGMLKWLYGDAQSYPELATNGGDPGLVALRGALSELLGIPIDYYAMVNMAGFVQMVEVFGGVEIDVEHRVQVRLLSPVEGTGWQQFDIQPGMQTMNGAESLAYARSRTGTSDYDRMARQRCVVQAVARQADLPRLLPLVPDLLEVVRNNVVTDIPVETLPEMVPLRDIARLDQVISIGFTPPTYLAGRSSQGFNLPAYDRITETVQSVIDDPDEFLNQNASNPLDSAHC